MPALDPDQLLALAERERNSGALGAPRQVDVRRSVSTSYYSIFHALCAEIADQFSRGNDKVWTLWYRAPDHGKAKSQCAKLAKDQSAPLPLQRFANSFVELQEKRNLADYDPTYRVSKTEAENLTQMARTALADLRSADQTQRLEFVASLIISRR